MRLTEPLRYRSTDRTPRMFAVACVLLAGPPCLPAQSPVWILDSKPTLVLGKATGDESEAFASITGATRLPNINNGYAILVFSVDGVLTGTFRFSTKVGNNIPYESACNTAGVFLHFGWESTREMTIGVYRVRVPMWLGGADSSAGRVLGTMQGWRLSGSPSYQSSRVSFER